MTNNDDMHSLPYKGSFWIWTDERGCNVFLGLRQGNPLDYAGAGRHPAGAHRGSGHCVLEWQLMRLVRFRLEGAAQQGPAPDGARVRPKSFGGRACRLPGAEQPDPSWTN